MNACTLASLVLGLLIGSPQEDDLVWVEGKVIIPEGHPESEPIEVVSSTRRLANGAKPRAEVGEDGSFRIGLPSRGLRARLDVEADFLHLRRTVRVHLRTPQEPVELRPELGVRIDVRLNARDGEPGPWEDATVTVLALVGEPDFLMGDHTAFELAGPDLTATFDGLPAADQYRFEVALADGVPILVEGVRVSPGTSKAVNVEVSSGTRLSGRVVDEDGRPVADAELELRMVMRGGSFHRQHHIRTRDDGSFVIASIPPAELQLLVSKRGFTARTVPVGGAAPGEDLAADPIVLSRGNRVTVEVVWPDGSLVDSARVSLDGPGEWRHGGSLTDGVRRIHGPYEYEGLGRGPFSVSAWVDRKDDGRERRFFALLEDVAPNTTARLVLQEGVPTTGRVVDEEGRPIEEVVLQLRPVGMGERLYPHTFRTFSHDQGLFTLDLHPGRWRLEVSGGGYGIQEVQVPSQEPQELVVSRAVTYSGIVLDVSGAPLPKARVQAGYTRYEPGGVHDTVTQALVEPDGTWSIRLPAGRVNFEAWFHARSSARIERSSKAGQVVADVRLVIE